MQREYGERWNTREIRKRMREHILIADSGYFTTENLYYLFINKINALIMPKKIAEEHNNKLRRENGHEEKRKDTDRKRFKRVKNDYIYPIGRFMRHLETIEINHRKPHLMMIFQTFAKRNDIFLKHIPAMAVLEVKTA